MAAAVVVGGLMAVAVALWLHYGTAVFFEIVRAGIAACL
jgi:ABC-type amino acid transport system permease subunit